MFGTCDDIDGKGTKCPRKSRCTSLCDPAEAKVSQDNVNYDNRIRIQNRRRPDSALNEWIDHIAFTVGTDMPKPVVDMETMGELDHLNLTGKQLKALISHFIDGMSLNDVGKEDGVSRQAIRNRFRRAGGSVKMALARRKMWNDNIRHILGKLSDQQQSAAFFFYFELMNYKDIAEAMNIKERQIRHMIKFVRKLSLGG